MTIKSVQSGYGMNYQEKRPSPISSNMFEEASISSEEIIDHRVLSKEEEKNLYYAYKANDLMKSKIEIYMDIEEKELKYKDIREIQEYENKSDLIKYYKNEVEIQNNDKKYEVWA